LICARSKQCASSGRKAQAGRRTPANPNSAPEGASGKGKARAGWRGRSRRARLRVERRALQVDLVRDLVALVNEVQAGRHGGVALELERAHLGHALDQVLHALVDRALVQDHAQALEDPAQARARLNLQPPSNACAGSAAASCGGASAHAWRGHLVGMKRRAGPSRNGQKRYARAAGKRRPPCGARLGARAGRALVQGHADVVAQQRAHVCDKADGHLHAVVCARAGEAAVTPERARRRMQPVTGGDAEHCCTLWGWTHQLRLNI